MDVAVVGVVGSVLGTIGGTLLGWYLSRKTIREVAQEERRWQEEQTIRERQDAAVEQLRTELIQLQGVLPKSVRSPAKAIDDLYAAHQQLREAWTRASLLTDEEIAERVAALDMAIFLAIQDSQGARSDANPINYYALEEAAVDLRKALDAFLRREQLSTAMFPSARDQVDIAGSHEHGFGRVARHQIERRIANRANKDDLPPGSSA